MTALLKNTATSSLASPIATTFQATLDVQPGDGAKFPSPSTAQEYFYITVEDATPNREIMICTSRTVDTLTVTRGQDGTTAQTFLVSAVVEMRANAGLLGDLRNEASGYNVVDKSATFNVTKDDNGTLFNITAGAFNINLGAYATFPANTFIMFKNSGTGIATLDGNGSETIDGNLTYSLAPGDQAYLIKGTSEFGIFSKIQSVNRVIDKGYRFGLKMDNTARSGATLITGWTNFGYDSFTNADPAIGNAQKTTAGTQFVRSNTFTPVTAGQTLIVTLTLTLSSGQAPSIAVVDTVFGNVSDYVQLVNGANTIYLTCWAPGVRVEFRSTANTHYSTGAITGNLQTLDQTEDVAVLAGVCRDTTDTANMILPAEIKKSVDTAWTEGNSQGGMPVGVTLSANTWYHMFVISKVDGTVDAGYDTSTAAVNLLADSAAAGYVYYRRVGSVLTNSLSDIVAFYQVGNEFYWIIPFLDWNASLGATGSLVGLTVPPDYSVRANMASFMNSDSGMATYHPPFVANQAASSSVSPLSMIGINTATPSNAEVNSTQIQSYTDTNANIFARGVGTVSVKVATLSWTDFIGD